MLNDVHETSKGFEFYLQQTEKKSCNKICYVYCIIMAMIHVTTEDPKYSEVKDQDN